VSSSRDLAWRADALTAARTPYATATVVRRQRPSSVRPGDSALVLPDGSIEGFVGGACAEQSVRLHALRALETGEPVLLRVLPGEDDAPAEEGAVTVHNPCLSGGALEIFIEPRLPAPRIVVVGDTPVAMALERLGRGVGFDVQIDLVPGELGPLDDDAAVVVASHGRGEEDALAAALEAGVAYVGLVASPKRGEAVRESLPDVSDADRERLRTPAGLDIGAKTPEEIALSILAEVIAIRARAEHHEDPAPAARVQTARAAVDPVCGMQVMTGASAPSASYGGRTIWFCCDGCRERFEADPSAYASQV
jgi:xanthine dehydrogenase accessory factor